MTVMRQLPAARYKAMKAAGRKLVADLGGPADAAAFTRVGATALYNYGNLDSAENFIPVDIVADLEAAAADPVVTRHMAAAQGYALIRPAGRVTPGLLPVALAQLGEQAGRIFAGCARDMADGRVTPAEAARTMAAVDDGLAALLALRDLLQAIADGGVDAFTADMERRS